MTSSVSSKLMGDGLYGDSNPFLDSGIGDTAVKSRSEVLQFVVTKKCTVKSPPKTAEESPSSEDRPGLPCKGTTSLWFWVSISSSTDTMPRPKNISSFVISLLWFQISKRTSLLIFESSLK